MSFGRLVVSMEIVPQKNTIHSHVFVPDTRICNHRDDGVLQLRRRCFLKCVFGAFVTLLIVTLLLLDQSNAPASAYRGYTAGKPLFHPSAPDRNYSPSGKNPFVSPLLCPELKNEKSSLDVRNKQKRDLTQGPFGKLMCQHFRFGFSCEALFKDTWQICRSCPATLDEVVVPSINHRLNQEREETTPLTTLSHHLFTSH